MSKLISAITAIGFISLCGGMMTHRQSLLYDIPRWSHISSISENISIHTLDGDETAHIELKNGQLTYSINGETHRYNEDYIVSDLFVFDVDHDMEDEVVLHVWKIGSFGDHRPFWKEDEPDDHMTEHIFIYDWETQRPERLRAI